MTPTKKAQALGIKFEKLEPGYLNRCVKSGKLLFTSGHTSKIKGRLGKDLQVEDGAKADGWHARSALGFASLPNGAAVEIEAIFEIKE